MKDPNGILMIEPQGQAAREPVVDRLTRMMTAALRNGTVSPDGYRGFHECKCGAHSDNKDHFAVVGSMRLMTNSLAVHYLAFHRPDVSEVELAKVELLAYGEEEPNAEELSAPRS